LVKSIDWNLYPYELLLELKRAHRKRDLELTKEMLPKFVFLCGKDINIDGGGNRQLISDLYSKNRNDIISVYSERLFSIFDLNTVDLLSFEELLAELSDGIILFVESYGTACELGAFAMRDELLDKLLVINGKEHYGKNTFINDGPIKKVQNRDEKRVIFAEMQAPFSSPAVLDSFIGFIEKNKKFRLNLDSGKVHLNPFVYELLELVTLLQPIQKNQLIHIYKFVKGFTSFEYFSNRNNKTTKKIQLTQILELMNSLDLVIINDQGFISINPCSEYDYRNIMFRLDVSRHNKLRAKFLNRKYKRKNSGLVVKVAAI